uniref:Putative ovule protein n=1 Tax=Solanum chacoense TaxID=4108 RepID=A0A0V0GMW9_SOLCH
MFGTKSYNSEEMANIDCLCCCLCASFITGRPRMSQVVRALEGDAFILDLDEENRPGQSTICDFDSDGSNYFEKFKKIQRSTLKSKEEW